MKITFDTGNNTGAYGASQNFGGTSQWVNPNLASALDPFTRGMNSQGMPMGMGMNPTGMGQNPMGGNQGMQDMMAMMMMMMIMNLLNANQGGQNPASAGGAGGANGLGGAGNNPALQAMTGLLQLTAKLLEAMAPLLQGQGGNNMANPAAQGLGNQFNDMPDSGF